MNEKNNKPAVDANVLEMVKESGYTTTTTKWHDTLVKRLGGVSLKKCALYPSELKKNGHVILCAPKGKDTVALYDYLAVKFPKCKSGAVSMISGKGEIAYVCVKIAEITGAYVPNAVKDCANEWLKHSRDVDKSVEKHNAELSQGGARYHKAVESLLGKLSERKAGIDKKYAAVQNEYARLG